MDNPAISLIQVCPAQLPTIPESRWEAVEAQIHEGLQFGVERYILDLTGAHEIRPLDYWMLLNLAILIPAGQLVVVADEAQFTQSLLQSKLSHLIQVVQCLADAYGTLTGIAAGSHPIEIPALQDAPHPFIGES